MQCLNEKKHNREKERVSTDITLLFLYIVHINYFSIKVSEYTDSCIISYIVKLGT